MKSIIVLIFSACLLLSTVTPTLATVLDTDYDLTLLLDANGEEEKEGKESSKEFEPKISQELFYNSLVFSETPSFNFQYYIARYTSAEQELTPPPPES